jgi:hypothetical protein
MQKEENAIEQKKKKKDTPMRKKSNAFHKTTRNYFRVGGKQKEPKKKPRKRQDTPFRSPYLPYQAV